VAQGGSSTTSEGCEGGTAVNTHLRTRNVEESELDRELRSIEAPTTADSRRSRTGSPSISHYRHHYLQNDQDDSSGSDAESDLLAAMLMVEADSLGDSGASCTTHQFRSFLLDSTALRSSLLALSERFNGLFS
jgi:hypothetical protein